MILMISMLLMSSQAHAYDMGTAPFCLIDNLGNGTCFYYSMDACRMALGTAMPGASCARK